MTVSLKQNRDFRRLYSSGKSAVNQYLAIYCRKNHLGSNRLGVTVGTKVGNAVKRNKVKRRIKEIYRTAESGIKQGNDIVFVARVRSASADFKAVENAALSLLRNMSLLSE